MTHGGDNREDCHAPQNDYWMRCRGGDARRTSDAARPRDGSLSSLPAPPPLCSFPSLPASPLRSLSSLPAPPLRYALIRTGTHSLSAPRCRDQRRHQMKTIIAILAVAFLAVTPAAAMSAKSFAPGHTKGAHHAASSFAPGHMKGLHMRARTFAPGHLKR